MKSKRNIRIKEYIFIWAAFLAFAGTTNSREHISRHSYFRELPEDLYQRIFSEPNGSDFFSLRQDFLNDLKKKSIEPKIFVEIMGHGYVSGFEGYTAFLISCESKPIDALAKLDLRYHNVTEKELKTAEYMLIKVTKNTVQTEPNPFAVGPPIVLIHFIEGNKHLKVVTFGMIEPLYEYDKEYDVFMSDLNRHNLLYWLSYMTKGDLKFLDYADYIDLDRGAYQQIMRLRDIESTDPNVDDDYSKNVLKYLRKNKLVK